MKKFKKEELTILVEEFMGELTKKENKSDRQMVMWRGCKKYGAVKHDSSNLFSTLCDDEECYPCRQIEKAFKEEAEKWQFYGQN